MNLRNGPSLNDQPIQVLDHNQTLIQISKNKSWLYVKTLSGQKGYVRNDMVSDIWIKVYKKERKLFMLKQDQVLKTYTIGLSSFNPLGDKNRLGDRGTPEGRFYVCELIRNPGQAKYGARSMRLSYPNMEDARRGLEKDLINFQPYLRILKNIKAGKMPNQKTPLGGSIRIHGGGSNTDWTLGCVALNDEGVMSCFFEPSNILLFK